MIELNDKIFIITSMLDIEYPDKNSWCRRALHDAIPTVCPENSNGNLPSRSLAPAYVAYRLDLQLSSQFSANHLSLRE